MRALTFIQQKKMNNSCSSVFGVVLLPLLNRTRMCSTHWDRFLKYWKCIGKRVTLVVAVQDWHLSGRRTESSAIRIEEG